MIRIDAIKVIAEKAKEDGSLLICNIVSLVRNCIMSVTCG
jgi:hypothetical protein